MVELLGVRNSVKSGGRTARKVEGVRDRGANHSLVQSKSKEKRGHKYCTFPSLGVDVLPSLKAFMSNVCI
jgi:hypothetical protein